MTGPLRAGCPSAAVVLSAALEDTVDEVEVEAQSVVEALDASVLLSMHLYVIVTEPGP